MLCVRHHPKIRTFLSDRDWAKSSWPTWFQWLVARGLWPKSAPVIVVCADADSTLSVDIECRVSFARDTTELAEALVEMFLPQLLRTSVTRDHTMRLPNLSRISRSPHG